MSQNANKPATISTSTFRTIKQLLTVYAAVGWLGFVTVVALSVTVAKSHPGLVDTTTWVHGLIVALTGIPFVALADKAARSEGGGATKRLRVVLTVVPISFIAVLFFLSLPTWMYVEQVICAGLLAAAAVVYFKRS